MGERVTGGNRRQKRRDADWNTDREGRAEAAVERESGGASSKPGDQEGLFGEHTPGRGNSSCEGPDIRQGSAYWGSYLKPRGDDDLATKRQQS